MNIALYVYLGVGTLLVLAALSDPTLDKSRNSHLINFLASIFVVVLWLPVLLVMLVVALLVTPSNEDL